MTIPALVDKFFYAKEFDDNLTVASMRAYHIGMRQFESCWQNLTTDDWAEFEEAVKRQKAMLLQNGLKPISLRAYVTVLRSFVNWSHQNGYRRGPYSRTKMKVPKLLPGFLEREEFMKLLTVPVDTRRSRRAQLATRVFLDTCGSKCSLAVHQQTPCVSGTRLTAFARLGADGGPLRAGAFYSLRSATRGSTRMARQAGISDAAKPVAASVRATGGPVKSPESLHRGRGVRIQSLKSFQVIHAVHGVPRVV
jgi:hypothetical protein